MGKSKEKEKEGKEEIIIDLTLSDDEIHEEINEINQRKSSRHPKTPSPCSPSSSPSSPSSLSPSDPFDPPLNISGNILESRHYKILKSHSAWFTDDIINAFFSILQSKNEQKCFVFSSFFYDSLLKKGKDYCFKNWTKRIKTFLNSSSDEDKIVLLPVNSGGSHWVLVAWSINDGTLNYYDSLMCKRSGNIIMKNMSEFFNEMIEYDHNNCKDEDIDILLSKLSFNNTTPLIKNNFIPKGQLQQTDGSSCGPFCCLNGKRLLETNQNTKTVVDIYEFRESLIEYFKENILN